jgi:broad specificity phosphatase PhoE
MKPPPCYCDQAPRDEATGQPRFRCNVCLNEVLAEKNRLVREEQCLPERLAGEFERGRQYGTGEEGARILGRIRQAIASWERGPRDDAADMVCAALDVLSCCITHRGVTRDVAVKAALDGRCAAYPESQRCVLPRGHEGWHRWEKGD